MSSVCLPAVRHPVMSLELSATTWHRKEQFTIIHGKIELDPRKEGREEGRKEGSMMQVPTLKSRLLTPRVSFYLLQC